MHSFADFSQSFADLCRNFLKNALLIVLFLTFFRILDDSRFFYLYRISYMWYSPIGFLMTVIIGLIVSYFCRLVFREKPQYLDPDLFFPCIGKCMRARQQRDNETDEKNFTNVTSYRFHENITQPEKNEISQTHI